MQTLRVRIRSTGPQRLLRWIPDEPVSIGTRMQSPTTGNVYIVSGRTRRVFDDGTYDATVWILTPETELIATAQRAAMGEYATTSSGRVW